jgi:hypothetical protein
MGSPGATIRKTGNYSIRTQIHLKRIFTNSALKYVKIQIKSIACEAQYWNNEVFLNTLRKKKIKLATQQVQRIKMAPFFST